MMSTSKKGARSTFNPPFRRRVVARLGFSPHYAGSSHDDAVARQLGFRAALIPGAFVYGFMSRVALDLWGREWLVRGQLTTRFRRPVYNGDALEIEVSTIARYADDESVKLVIRNARGDDVAIGSVGLPGAPPAAPDLSKWPVLDAATVGTPPTIGPGELSIGFLISSRNEVISEPAFLQSLEDFSEDHPVYQAEGIIHAGMLLRQAMGDANRSGSFLSPVILVSSTTQALGIAHVGDRLATSGWVTAVYERKGNHYFDSSEVLIANGCTPIASFQRCSIYAARQQPFSG